MRSMYCTGSCLCSRFRLYDERVVGESTGARLHFEVSMQDGCFRIAHISDLHCGGPYFVPSLLERAIDEINDLGPDVVVCSGDLTTFGFKHEYVRAKSFLDRVECPELVVVPG